MSLKKIAETLRVVTETLRVVAETLCVVATIAAISAVLIAVFPGQATAGERSTVTIPGKVGYVDFSRALNGVSDGRSARKRLGSEFKDRQQQLDKLQASLERLKRDIDKERMVISTDLLSKMEEDYRRKYFELQQKFATFRNDMALKESQYTKKILLRLRKIVRNIALSEGYDLILEKSQDVVIYSSASNDLTDRVISSYDGRTGGRRK
jgi:outer membrane protein